MFLPLCVLFINFWYFQIFPECDQQHYILQSLKIIQLFGFIFQMTKNLTTHVIVLFFCRFPISWHEKLSLDSSARRHFIIKTKTPTTSEIFGRRWWSVQEISWNPGLAWYEKSLICEKVSNIDEWQYTLVGKKFREFNESCGILWPPAGWNQIRRIVSQKVRQINDLNAYSKQKDYSRLHVLEISRFFCHSDFMWNNLGEFRNCIIQIQSL